MYMNEMPSSIHDYVARERYICSDEWLLILNSFWHRNLLSQLHIILFYFLILLFVYLICRRNYEYIAMYLLIANATKAPPIWVKGFFYSFKHTFDAYVALQKCLLYDLLVVLLAYEMNVYKFFLALENGSWTSQGRYMRLGPRV